jgi:SecD/SecF fusion protein
LIAVLHDILITAGVYALFGFEVTTATVAALLTILGFSLYDTIIVFDRVRENVPRMPRAAFSQILNRSMSEVLMRSLATSLCTGLPVIAILFFGGQTLKDFAFALAVGVISGTYSSVFIATPVLMHWKEAEGVWRKRRARVAAANGGVVPAYATAAGGAATEAEPEEERRPRKRLTAPDDPNRSVSADEFQDLVADLGIESETGRRATATAEPELPAPVAGSGADLAPEDLVLKDEPSKTPKSKRPRNRRHGR